MLSAFVRGTLLHVAVPITMFTYVCSGGRRFSEGTSADREIQRTLMEVCLFLSAFSISVV